MTLAKRNGAVFLKDTTIEKAASRRGLFWPSFDVYVWVIMINLCREFEAGEKPTDEDNDNYTLGLHRFIGLLYMSV